jgi:hypothetical protein
MNTPSERPEANRPIDDADALLGDWIQEAGDPSMEPRSEHVDELREKLLGRTRQSQPSQIDEVADQHHKTNRRTARQWSVLAVVTAVVLIAVSLNPGTGRKDAAWAQVKEAVRAMPWMLTRTQIGDGAVSETWFSPQRLVAASRTVLLEGASEPRHGQQAAPPFAVFIDVRKGTRLEYRQQPAEVIKSPVRSSDITSMRLVGGFLTAFSDGHDLRDFADANPELSVTAHREITVDGKPFEEIDAVFALEGRETRCTYRVDPKTRLPVTVTSTHNGETLSATISFPEFGPKTIYELGVPEGVAVVDRMPSPKLARLLEQRKSVRKDFDRYYGLAVSVRPGAHWSQARRVTRLWRSGTKWRAEYMICDPVDSKRISDRELPADDTDPAQWWFKQVKKERFRPTTLSDGKRTWRFEFDAKPSTPEKTRFEYTIKPGTMNPYPIDPSDPMPTIIEYPEFLAYGATGLPSANRKGTLTLEPKDGPAGTVLLTSRSTKPPRQNGYSNDLSHYWLDPLENGLCRRTQMFSLAGDKQKLHGEQLLLETAHSPQGYAYPTKLQHDDSTVTHFYLDFDASFDDSVFDPTINRAAPSPE